MSQTNSKTANREVVGVGSSALFGYVSFLVSPKRQMIEMAMFTGKPSKHLKCRIPVEMLESVIRHQKGQKGPKSQSRLSSGVYHPPKGIVSHAN